MSSTFDVAVVGLGMIGSACARHLAESGVSVVALGPAEPADERTHDGPFGSHYDEGRITRISAFDSRWSELASRSIGRYADIATRSGIDFHVPCGLVVIAPNADVAVENALSRGGEAQLVSPQWLREVHGIEIPSTGRHLAAREGPPAGYINPRRLVAAQIVLAERADCVVVRRAVDSVTPERSGVVLDGPAGSVRARRVVLATGVYGARPAGVELAIERRLRTIVRADVGPGPDLPSLIVDEPGHDELECYWVPPVRYPDVPPGTPPLLKIGGDSVPLHVAESDRDIADWFRQGGLEAEADSLRSTLSELLPHRPIGYSDNRACVIANTATGLPYIDWIDDAVAVAVGGCGSAAKSSDEIGRLAAALATDSWSSGDLRRDLFAAVVGDFRRA